MVDLVSDIFVSLLSAGESSIEIKVTHSLQIMQFKSVYSIRNITKTDVDLEFNKPLSLICL